LTRNSGLYLQLTTFDSTERRILRYGDAMKALILPGYGDFEVIETATSGRFHEMGRDNAQ